MSATHALLALVLAAPLVAQAAPAPLTVLPSRIALDDGFDRQRFVVLQHVAPDLTRDVTAQATLALEAPLARIEAGTLVPVADGTTRLVARLGDHEAAAEVVVKHASRHPQASFANEVIPILTRSGCNAGACHGAASGKNGFRLSLFGFDTAHDWRALSRDLRGRRLDCADPDASLMLRKPTTQVAHQGGKRLETSSDLYARLRTWIAEGAQSDVGQAPALAGLEVEPAGAVLVAGTSLQAIVRARYGDGSDRDATALALLSSSDDSVARVDGQGHVTAERSGEATILVRFGTLAQVARIVVVPSAEGVAWPAEAVAANYVDEAIFAKLRQLRLQPAASCSDEEFLRRLYLDLLAVLPDPEATRAFLADTRTDKRERLIDELLARPELADVLALQWAETLRIEPQQLEAKGVHVYSQWLRQAFRTQRPFDQVVRELLLAEGGGFEVPPANFWLVERDPKLLAENAAQAFLGVRLQCAQCHNHPFERWTMDDYYGFAAFFARVGSKRGEDPREQIVFGRGQGEVQNVRTGAVAPPRLLGGPSPKLAPNDDRRRALALWLTAAENPWFATNVANRLFARVFGRGLVEPPDDVRVSNPPSHPELYQELGRRLVAYGWDMRRLLKDLVSSRAYQLAAHPQAPPSAFAGRLLRRLSAEQLLDAIGSVTGVPTKHRGLPLGARSTEIADGRSETRFLNLFGRPARTSACTCERRDEPTLRQTLHLINGETIEAKLRADQGRLARLIRAKAEDAAIADELWVAAYCRRPSPAEAERVLGAVREAKDRRAAWADVGWAVLNSKEFLFNH